MRELQATASALKLQVSTLEIRRPEEIAPAIESLKGKGDALFVITDPLIFSNRTKIIAWAQEARIPTVCSYEEWAEAGCLMSYGPNFPDMWRRTAEFVDKI